MPDSDAASAASHSGGTTRKVRVGLLVDSLTAPAWVYAMLARVRAQGEAEIAVVIRNAAPQPPRPPAWKRLWGYRHHLLYLTYRKLDQKLFRARPDAFESRDLTPLLAHVPRLDVVPRQTKFSDYFTESDLAQLAEYDLDVMVRLGFRILRGQVLSAARCGVWSFHHGDPDVFRGGPAGTWEVLFDQPTLGSVLQIINEDLDGGVVLYRSQSTTDSVSLVRSLNSHYWKTLSFLPRSLAQLHRLGCDRFLEQARDAQPTVNLYSHRMYTAPRNGEMIGLLACLAVRMAQRWRQVRFSPDHWFLIAQPTETPAGSLSRFRPIRPPRDRFWADPNVVEHEGHCYVFIEDYFERTGKGSISVFAIEPDGRWPEQPALVLDRPYHLAYPFVFKHDGQYHMLVESSTQRRVESYRCVEFPHRWEGPTILMDNVSATDATLHEQDGRWWMFCSIVENPGSMPWDELFLFHATDPFSGQWTPHPLNPIVSDARRARPAGPLFWQDGKLIRPAQNCGGGYGRGVYFNEVLKLNEAEYEERPIAQIEPKWLPGIRGTHTFTRGGGWTVCDANQWRRRF